MTDGALETDRQDDELLAQIKELVSRQTAISESKLTLATRLGQDLGVDGDDAEEFLLAFQEQFGVDMSGFEFDRYFGPEAAFNPLAYLWRRLFARRQEPLRPVRLSDLVASAKASKWCGA